MSTDTGKTELPSPIKPPISIKDLTEVLVKHYGIHEGQYDLLVEFQIGTGAAGPTPDRVVPSAMIGIAGVGLVNSPRPGPNTIDAAEVNPKGKPRK